eukprot:588705-Alexandrium_andersonii.AAC.1
MRLDCWGASNVRRRVVQRSDVDSAEAHRSLCLPCLGACHRGRWVMQASRVGWRVGFGFATTP